MIDKYFHFKYEIALTFPKWKLISRKNENISNRMERFSNEIEQFPN